MLRFFRDLSHPDSLMAFDYHTPAIGLAPASQYGVKEFTATMREQHPNEVLLFTLSERELESFLAEHDLFVREHLTNRDIEQAYLQTSDGSLLGQITGHFRFVTIAKSDADGS